MNLGRAKTKIDPDAMETYDDVMETLRFLNTVESDVSVVPPLSLQSLGRYFFSFLYFFLNKLTLTSSLVYYTNN